LLSSAAPAIQWYPGHIAKAERSLTDNLAKVDLVIEVRDARIPTATGHPRL
jgi:ribosome biogenesis GTPase A